MRRVPNYSDRVLIVQSDRTILLEVDNPAFGPARDQLVRFAELVKSPEHIHTYRLTALSLWNAAAAGLTSQEIIQALEAYSKYTLPANVCTDIREYCSRYGRLKLKKTGDGLALVADAPILITEIANHKLIAPLLKDQQDARTLLVDSWLRGQLKQALIKIGFPVEDLAGYVPGSPLDISLRPVTRFGEVFNLRDYQLQASRSFYAAGSAKGGSGVVVLPCGAGKTVVGLAVMSLARCYTLILVTNITAARQWIEELLDKTDLPEDQIGEYSGEVKDIKPVTVATYQILTHRRQKTAEHPHFALFNQQDWGLIIYDEVHLLPAPVFRITAEIQARRRLGLTATLVREDQREGDVFSLIGPKKFDLPWKELEKQGWIATATCHEVRLDLLPEHRLAYATASEKEKFRLASENPAKETVIKKILERHPGDQVLIIGQYLEQLKLLAGILQVPLITGQVAHRERERLVRDFKEGRLRCLVVSKVANFAVDLPEASVAIQVSGSFGSRQEEAQRLGRVLRPKKNANLAYFYTLVTRETKEQEFAAHRQLFLTEQGYRYQITGPDFTEVSLAPGQAQSGRVVNLAEWRARH